MSSHASQKAASLCYKCSQMSTSGRILQVLYTYFPQAHQSLMPASPTSILQEPPNLDAEVKKWFPRAIMHEQPKLRVVCFHGAGSAANVYTGSGTGVRRMPNPLVDFCRASSWDLLAVQLPGRETRRTEKFAQSIHSIAEQLGSVLLRLFGKDAKEPFVFVGHSMGSWVAFEVALYLQRMSQGYLVPRHLFVACFPSPSLDRAERPWRQSTELNNSEMQEECRHWNTNEQVFQPEVWKVYERMLRADFKLFDTYEHACATGKKQHEAGGLQLTIDTLLLSSSVTVTPTMNPVSVDNSLVTAFCESQLADDGASSISLPPSTQAPTARPCCKLATSFTGIFAKDDKRITEAHLNSWKNHVDEAHHGEFIVLPQLGHHLFVYDGAQRAAWFQLIVDCLVKQQEGLS